MTDQGGPVSLLAGVLGMAVASVAGGVATFGVVVYVLPPILTGLAR